MRFWPRRSLEEKAATLAAPDAELLALFGVTAGPIAVSRAEALSVPAVNCAIRCISEACATLDRRVMRIEPDGSLVPDDQHPAARLLMGDVNPWLGSSEFIRDLVAQALMDDAGGLAFVNRVDGKPIELIHYRGGVIGVTIEDTGEPLYKINNRPAKARDILHLRGPFNKSPLSLAAQAIGVAYHMERHAGRMFKNGARPGGVIEMPQNQLGERGIKNVKAGWSRAHEGEDKTGLTAVLWGGATYKQFTLTSVDAQFLELRKFQIEEIARAFRVPVGMLYQLDRVTWSNGEQQGKEFLTYSLEPWLQALESVFLRALFNENERSRYRVVFDRDDLTRASLTERATAISSLRSAEVINANEGRDWLGMQPRDGGNEFKNPNITTTTTTTSRGREDA